MARAMRVLDGEVYLRAKAFAAKVNTLCKGQKDVYTSEIGLTKIHGMKSKKCNGYFYIEKNSLLNYIHEYEATRYDEPNYYLRKKRAAIFQQALDMTIGIVPSNPKDAEIARLQKRICELEEEITALKEKRGLVFDYAA